MILNAGKPNLKYTNSSHNFLTGNAMGGNNKGAGSGQPFSFEKRVEPLFKSSNKSSDFYSLLNSLYELALSYSEITEGLYETDINFDTVDENLSEISEIFEHRDDLIKRMNELKNQISACLYDMPENISSVYSSMFAGNAPSYSLSAEEQSIYNKISEINNKQAQILEKDKAVAEKLSVRLADLRQKLADLKEDKKIIEFANSSGMGKASRSGTIFNEGV